MLATGDSAQTLRQAQKAYRASMATGEPSAADMRTAMKARATVAEAHQLDRERALQAYSLQAAEAM